MCSMISARAHGEAESPFFLTGVFSFHVQDQQVQRDLVVCCIHTVVYRKTPLWRCSSGTSSLLKTV
jgi:hypothetical protein